MNLVVLSQLFVILDDTNSSENYVYYSRLLAEPFLSLSKRMFVSTALEGYNEVR